MHLDELTRAMLKFVDSKGWRDDDSPKPQSPRSLAISLALEAAEVLAHISGVDLGEAVLDKLRKNEARDWTAPDADEVSTNL